MVVVKMIRALLVLGVFACTATRPALVLVAGERGLIARSHEDGIDIEFGGQRFMEFVVRDQKILRPYFANVLEPAGLQVTRNHPPIEGEDATDHDTMHPGLWLAFGDVNGADFWRNKGRIEHVRFVERPNVHDGHIVTFATECRLVTVENDVLCTLINRYSVLDRPYGLLVVWDAQFNADRGDVVYGDQEEMGFGARVATEITEKNGGVIRNSHGVTTAEKTWGQPAAWCDYSKTGSDGRRGITLMPDPANFRESWWHTRDYGVFVANPFGRAAMKQGEKSAVTVKNGETFRIRFAAAFHGSEDYDPAEEYKHACEVMKASE